MINQATIQAIPAPIEHQMKGVSYKPNCPVPISQLRYLTLPYYGVDHKKHTGHLIINKMLATETVSIFEALYHQKIVIAKMLPYSNFKVTEYAKNNDTVGFYCRPDQGNSNVWSKHAYGLAIDINPLWNPYLECHQKPWPEGSEPFVNRHKRAEQIQLGGPTFTIFAQHGWIWGGTWQQKDTMHFQKMMNGYYRVDKLSLIPRKERISALSN